MMGGRINQATKKEHFAPGPEYLGKIKELVEKWIQYHASSDDEVPKDIRENPELSANTLFGMLNLKAQLEQMKAKSPDILANNLETLSENLGIASKGYDDDLTFWFTELVQNALDANWGGGDGAAKITLELTGDKIVFSHDGRPPHFRNEQIHEVLGGDEFLKMVFMGSSKRSQFDIEGRFGIGFKFWTFHFENASLDAEGWQFAWDREFANSPTLDESAFAKDAPMRLTFTNPRNEAVLRDKCADPSKLIEDMKRLMAGILLLDRKCEFTLKVDGQTEWVLTHAIDEIEDGSGTGVEGDLKLFHNESIISRAQDGDEGRALYVPRKMLTYSVNLDDGRAPARLIESVVEAFTGEFMRSGGSYSVRQLTKIALEEYEGAKYEPCDEFGFCDPEDDDLCNSCWPKGKPSISDYRDYEQKTEAHRSLGRNGKLGEGARNTLENHLEVLRKRIDSRKAAEYSLRTLNLSIIADISSDDESRSHQLLYSMFPIGKEGSWGRFEETSSRFTFKAPFDLMPDREALQVNSKRNPVLAGGLAILWESLMRELSDASLRDALGIGPEIYLDLLEGVDSAGGEKFEELLDSYITQYDFSIHDLMTGDAWPGVSHEPGAEPSQDYFRRSEARLLRPAIEHLLSSDEGLRRDWALECIHPNECCLITEEGFRGYFPWLLNWDIDEQDAEERESRHWQGWSPAVDADDQRSEDVAEELAGELVSWPEWLPLPLKDQEDVHGWYQPEALSSSIVQLSESTSEPTDDQLRGTLELAEDRGIRKLHFSSDWTSLLKSAESVREIPLGTLSQDLLYERCVEHIVKDEEGIEGLRGILEECGQETPDRWPYFLQNEQGHLLMVSKPDPKWKRTLVAVNDDDEKKSLWHFGTTKTSGRETTYFQSISSDAPAEHGQPEGEWPGRYVRNLTEDGEEYSHIVVDDPEGSTITRSYGRVVQQMSAVASYSTLDQGPSEAREGEENEARRPIFSKVDLTYSPRTTKPHLGRMMKFNACSAFPLNGTGDYQENSKATRFLRQELPPLPGLLHALFLPHAALRDVSSPVMRGQKRSGSSQFTTDSGHSLGFIRHVLRIPDEDEITGNSPDNKHHRRPSLTEKQGADDSSNESSAWKEMSENQGVEEEGKLLPRRKKDKTERREPRHGRNYCLLLRAISPAAAAFEIALETFETDEQGEIKQRPTKNTIEDCLCLASASHLEHAFVDVSMVKADQGLLVPWQCWVAYWGREEGDVRDRTQRLYLEGLSASATRKQDDNIYSSVLYLDGEALERYSGRAGIVRAFDHPVHSLSLDRVGQNRIGQTRRLWRANPVKGDLINMAHELLQLRGRPQLAVDEEMILATEWPSAAKAQRALRNLREWKDADPMMLSSQSAHERTNIHLWLWDPSASEQDHTMVELVEAATKAPDSKYLALMLIAEAIWASYRTLMRRRLSEAGDDEQKAVMDTVVRQIETRLAKWRGGLEIAEADLSDWASPEFLKALNAADAGEDTTTLRDKMEDAIGKPPKQKTSNLASAFLEEGRSIGGRVWNNPDSRYWRNRTVGKSDGAKARVRTFKEELLFSENDLRSYMRLDLPTLQGGGDFVPAHGFGIANSKRLLEIGPSESKLLREHYPEWKDKLITVEKLKWTDQLKRAFEESSVREQGHGEPGLSLPSKDKAHYGFLADRLMILAAAWFDARESTAVNINEFLRRLPKEIRIDDECEPTTPVGTEGQITLGNGGWSLEYEEDVLRISTARNVFGSRGMDEKIDILRSILDAAFHDLNVDGDNIDYNDTGFKNHFGIESDIEAAIRHYGGLSPLRPSERQYWIERVGVSEPDQKLIELLSDSDAWMTPDRANETKKQLLDDANNWLSRGSEQSSELKGDLLRLYSGHACTLLDLGTFTLVSEGLEDESSTRARMDKLLLRGHSRDAGNPLPPGPEPPDHREYSGSGALQHIGNHLLVSSQAHSLCKHTNGWRLHQPPKSTSEGFMEWIRLAWRRKFEAEPDGNYIVLDDVVKLGGEDDRYDARGRLLVHKLHLLYIMAYQEALDKRLDRERKAKAGSGVS